MQYSQQSEVIMEKNYTAFLQQLTTEVSCQCVRFLCVCVCMCDCSPGTLIRHTYLSIQGITLACSPSFFLHDL